MTQNHKHKCPICGDKYSCMTSFGHASDQVENFVCEGDYDSPCDNHTMDEITQYCLDEGLIDEIKPVTPENYGSGYTEMTRNL